MGVNKKGKQRYINKLSSIDRLILRAISQGLQKKYNLYFSKYSFAYQEGKSTLSAVLQAAKYIESGKEWMVRIDIENFFDNINLSNLENKMRKIIVEEDVIRCCLLFFQPQIMRDGSIRTKKMGIIQGSSLSPFLSNLYLHELDCILEDREYSFCRFGDDIILFTNDLEQAQEVQKFVCDVLFNEFYLKVSKNKSGIFPALKQKKLGYEFTKDKKSGVVNVKRYIPEFTSYYNNWNISGLCKVDRNYHLVNKGILNRKDYTLLFENETGKRYLPVECVESIGIYSNITFQSGLLEYLSDKQIRIILYDRFGNYKGSFMPAKLRNLHNKTIMKQMQIYFDESKRMDIARRIIIAGVHNMRANVRYYLKRKRDLELKNIESKMTEAIADMVKAATINELMLIEARTRQRYYQSFNYIINNMDIIFNIKII